MANKTNTPVNAAETAQPDNTTAPELLEIGALRQKHKIGPGIFAGVCGANGWRPGKRVSEDEFLREVYAFKKTPISRKRG